MKLVMEGERLMKVCVRGAHGALWLKKERVE